MNWKNHAMPKWETYSEELQTERRQCIEEGRDISRYDKLFDALIGMSAGEDKEALADALFEALQKAPEQAGYAYDEPSGLAAIRAARPADAPVLPAVPDRAALYEKIYGAWRGRVCGCLLGKPVEGMRTPTMKKLMEKQGNVPLHTYFRSDDEFLKDRAGTVDTLPGYSPSDDDTNYTAMAAVCVIDRYGKSFKPEDMADVWLANQPRNAYCTAERAAFRNFMLGIYPPQSAVYKNPYREWIGAQIRGDYFGYICPGDPEAAAELAWRDACISHVKNGIYGEMFIAAMLAAAAVTDDVHVIIRAGLAQIPAKSRLTESVEKIVAAYDAGARKDGLLAIIHSDWDEFNAHDWCHTVSNAMIVAASLLCGGLDYTDSICMAVEAGFDTDCNGATVGSVVGMVIGRDGIGEEWYGPTNDTVDTSICAVGKVTLADMTGLTLKHIGI